MHTHTHINIPHHTTSDIQSNDHTRYIDKYKTSGHCFETNAEFQLEDVDTATSSTMFRNLNTRNPPFQIRSYRKVQTFRESMNRLHQSINQYPVDLFNSFVARLRLANKHLFDKRSTEGHD